MTMRQIAQIMSSIFPKMYLIPIAPLLHAEGLASLVAVFFHELLAHALNFVLERFQLFGREDDDCCGQEKL